MPRKAKEQVVSIEWSTLTHLISLGTTAFLNPLQLNCSNLYVLDACMMPAEFLTEHMLL